MKKHLNTYLYLVFVFAAIVGYTQQRPFINNIDKQTGIPGDTIFISGTGFSTGNMEVFIGHGKVENIVSESATSLQVIVPMTATYGNIIAQNTSSGLSGKSVEYFTPAFSGGDFNPDKVSSQKQLLTFNQFTYDLCACDLDGDGLTDISAANNNSGNVSFFRNQSKPNSVQFNRDVDDEDNDIPTVITQCGDLNGDGKPEVVFTSGEGDAEFQIFIYTNISTVGDIDFEDANIKFSLPKNSNNENRLARRFAIADIDGDGKNDLTIGNTFDNSLFIYRNTTSSSGGTITFANPYEFTVSGTDQVGSVEVADLNNDGIMDIVTLPYNQNQEQINLIRNESSPGTFKLINDGVIGSGSNRLNLGIADLNGDYLPEIISNNVTDFTIEIYKNNSTGGNLSFETSPSRIQNATQAWGFQAADMNGDGLVDIVASSAASRIFVAENKSTLSDFDFTLHSLPTLTANRNIEVFDVDHDAKPDLVFVNSSEASTEGRIGVILNQNCLSPAIFPEDLTFCRNNAFELFSTKAYNASYQWTNPSGNAVFTENNDKVRVTVNTGTSVSMAVEITSNDGQCTDKVTQTFNIANGTPSLPSIIVTQDPSKCNGTDITLEGPDGFNNYYWTLPNGSQTTTTTKTLNILNSSSEDAGIYELRTQVDGECSSDAATQIIDIDEPPLIGVFNNGKDEFCETGETELEIPNISGFTFQWKKDGVELSGETGTTLTVNSSLTSGGLTGDYTVDVISSAGCKNQSLDYALKSVALPSSSFDSPAKKCVNVDADFTATSTGEDGYDLEYVWDFGDNSSETGLSTTHSYSTNNRYTVTLTTSYSDVEACSASNTETITITPIPSIKIKAPQGEEKCPSDSLELRIDDTSVVSYLWSNGSTDSSIYGVTEPDEDESTYSVEIETDVECVVTDEITISNYQNSRISIATSDIGVTINNREIQLEDDQTKVTLRAENGYDYLWSPSRILSDSTSDEVEVFPELNSTVVKVTGKDDLHDCITSDSVTVLLPGIIARKSFSPNGDNEGFDCWQILNTSNTSGCTVYIFDTRGSLVFEGQSPFNNDCVWNGNIDNGSTPAPEGVYYYVMKCDQENNNLSGSILLGR